MTFSNPQSIASASFVLDSGVDMVMVHIPEIVGAVEIENVYEEEDDWSLPDGTSFLKAPKRIKEVVIRIPVQQAEDGTYYTTRSMKNTDSGLLKN